jgi:hypothetical protein
MKLATPEQVLQARSIVSNEGSLATAAVALELSYPVIEGILETSLVAGSATDFFSVGDVCHKYRLTNAFVDEFSVVVRISDDGLPLTSASAGTVLPATEYILDAQRGTIYLLGTQLTHDLSMTVTYEYGFPASDVEDVLQVPQWLQSAHVAIATAYLLSSPASPAGRKEKALSTATKEMYGAGKSALAPYYRPRMGATYPARSVLNV